MNATRVSLIFLPIPRCELVRSSYRTADRPTSCICNRKQVADLHLWPRLKSGGAYACDKSKTKSWNKIICKSHVIMF